MKTNYLLPHKFKLWGILLVALGLVIYFVYLIFGDIPYLSELKILAMISTNDSLLGNDKTRFFKIIEDDFTFELIASLLIIGGLFIAFARQKIEDEMIRKIRLDSLVWATYIHYIMFLVLTLILYGFGYVYVIYANMFSLLLFFIIRFYYNLHKLNKTS